MNECMVKYSPFNGFMDVQWQWRSTRAVICGFWDGVYSPTARRKCTDARSLYRLFEIGDFHRYEWIFPATAVRGLPTWKNYKVLDWTFPIVEIFFNPSRIVERLLAVTMRKTWHDRVVADKTENKNKVLKARNSSEALRETRQISKRVLLRQLRSATIFISERWSSIYMMTWWEIYEDSKRYIF